MIKFFKILITILIVILVSNSSLANDQEVEKINKQLKKIKTLFEAEAIDKEEYNKIKSRLEVKKQNLLNPPKNENNDEEIEKINKQLETLKLYLKQMQWIKEYDKIKSRLEVKKQNLINPPKNEIDASNLESVTLRKQIEVLEKLFKDGVLSKEELEK